MVVTLKNDMLFKAVFGRDEEECKDALMGMLNLILDRKEDPIEEIEYINPFNIPDCVGTKESVLDIKAKAKTGEIFNVEMQLIYDKELIMRNIYYHCGMVKHSLAKGNDYGKMKKNISIYLVNYTLFPKDTDYYRCFMLRDCEKGEILTDLLQMYYIELPKVNSEGKPASELNQLECFLEYLRCAEEPGQEAYVEELKKQGGKEIRMTEEILSKVTAEERLWAEAVSREQFLHQQAAIRREMNELQQKKRELAAENQGLLDKNQELFDENQELIDKNQELVHKKIKLEERDGRLIRRLFGKGFDVKEIAAFTEIPEYRIKEYLK